MTTAQRADQTISYVFEASAGQTYLIEVEQHGLDFIVTVEDPAGTRQSYNSPLMRDESDFVLLEGTDSGRYRVDIHSQEYTGTQAGHSIRVDALRSDSDSADMRAWRLMSQAAESDSQGNPTDAMNAAVAYERTAGLWRDLGQPREQAQALFSVAMLEYWQLEHWDRSAKFAAAAAELYQELGETHLYGKAIYVQGYALLEVAPGLGPDAADSAFTEAFALLEESKRIFEARDDRLFDLAQVENNIGYAYFAIGDWDSARPRWRVAADLYAQLDEWSFEVQPLQNLAVVEAERGHLTAAAEALERIIDVLPEQLRLRRGTYLNNLGAFHRELGNFDEALAAYSEALAIHETIGDEPGEGQSRVGLGLVYSSLGELELAEELLEAALPITEKANDYERQGLILRTLGNIAYQRENFAAALKRHQDALLGYTSAPSQARIQTLIARDLSALGRFEEASRLAEEARDLAEQAGASKLMAEALLQLGLSELAAGNHQAAQANLETAHDIYEKLNLRADESDTLNGLALVARGRGDLATALRYSEAALQQLESSRTGVSSPELRAFFSAQRRSYYETHLGLLIDLYGASSGRDDSYLLAALEVAERARGRMLTDLLAESSVDLDQNIGAESAARRSELLRQLAELRYQRDGLFETGVLGSDAETALAAVIGEMARVENELNVIETDRRSKLGLTASETLMASEIQRSIEPGSVLLEYALADKASYVFVVEPDSVDIVELAGRDEIELAARRAFDQLRTFRVVPQRVAQVEQALRDLSELILMPIAASISGKRLMISSDGALQYIPFPALPLLSGKDNRPLLATNEVIVVPSMTALAAQQERVGLEPPSKTLAVFADPVFGTDDPRLGANHTASSIPAIRVDLLTRSSVVTLGKSNAKYLPRLAATGEEARAIAALVSPPERMVAMGLEATVERVQSTDLSNYRYVHFATHGLIDSRYPALSALALSRVDRNGASIDGWLRLHDIYDMQFNADLVVLSACETALGREIRGEGLVGLTQGFLSAGARNLVVSLWQVPDRATAQLMSLFYEYLIGDGLEPTAALRKAQMSVASETRWHDPYFWSSFVVVGAS